MRTAFKDIKADILDKITAGHWPLGGLLPNEVDLAESYGCARATVNRAMQELADEGIIERRRKAGTRVRRAPARQARFDIPLVRAEIEATGAKYRYMLLSRAAGPAPDWLRARLSLDQSAQALHLRAVHFADGAAYQFEDRWINLARLPQALEADFEAVGPNEWLIETVPFTEAEISFSAANADADLAQHMGCAQGEALFILERATWLQGSAITYVRLTFQRGHRMTTRY